MLKVIDDLIDIFEEQIILNIFEVLCTYDMIFEIFVLETANITMFVFLTGQWGLDVIVLLLCNTSLLIVEVFSLCEFSGKFDVSPLRQKEAKAFWKSLNTMEL